MLRSQPNEYDRPLLRPPCSGGDGGDDIGPFSRRLTSPTPLSGQKRRFGIIGLLQRAVEPLDCALQPRGGSLEPRDRGPPSRDGAVPSRCSALPSRGRDLPSRDGTLRPRDGIVPFLPFIPRSGETAMMPSKNGPCKAKTTRQRPDRATDPSSGQWGRRHACLL